MMVLFVSVFAAAILTVMPVAPAMADTVYQVTSPAAVDMVEPITVDVTWPTLPNKILPGEMLSWSFKVKNISSRGYWVTANVLLTAAENSPWPWLQWEGSQKESTQTGGGPYTPGQPVYLRPGVTTEFSITLIFREDSPVAKGIKFTPEVVRVLPPKPGGQEKGG
jgi:hypothetical protein